MVPAELAKAFLWRKGIIGVDWEGCWSLHIHVAGYLGLCRQSFLLPSCREGIKQKQNSHVFPVGSLTKGPPSRHCGRASEKVPQNQSQGFRRKSIGEMWKAAGWPKRMKMVWALLAFKKALTAWRELSEEKQSLSSSLEGGNSWKQGQVAATAQQQTGEQINCWSRWKSWVGFYRTFIHLLHGQLADTHSIFEV